MVCMCVFVCLCVWFSFFDAGIVPITCEELFKGIEEKEAGGMGIEFQVALSMLEIYNEQVRTRWLAAF